MKRSAINTETYYITNGSSFSDNFQTYYSVTVENDSSTFLEENDELTSVLMELVNQSVELILLYSEDLVHAAYRACDAGWRPMVTHGFLQTDCWNCSNGIYNTSSINLSTEGCRKNNTDICESHPLEHDLHNKKATTTKSTPRMAGGRDSWSLTGALLYAVTVITTIGYGHIVPRTDLGRAITVVYALFGIPLVLLHLTNLGGFLANCVRFVYLNICLRLWKNRRNRKVTERVPKLSTKSQCSATSDPESIRTTGRQDCILDHLTSRSPVVGSLLPGTNTPCASHQGDQAQLAEYEKRIHSRTARQSVSFDKTAHQILHSITTSQSILSKTSTNQRSPREARVPIWFTLLVFAIYVIVGAIIFANWEDWTFLQSAYFIFITLSTIGFGDFVPGIQSDHWYEDSRKPVFCCFYLLFGLSMIAMCFNLMQEEVKTKFRQFARKIGLVE